ncbi:protein kinase domain-containing protein [Sorangium sp. So ce131]|uniref:serine/threonine-protein kinase n=1 Tax=Sorangium sp. So ce131 TaxID=3133282 RepID=UPI003F62B76A
MSQPKSPTLLASGVLIDRKYRLVRQIGEGAMGVVWSAVNVATAREVALKLIHRPETEFRLRLQREARNCGALRHRNVIDIYDMGETEAGEPFLVMQLLTGETVAELLARRRRLDTAVAASIGRDVARGLAAAHGMHIIHRDLKPANIFLHREPDMDEPVVKVLDFGVAKNLSVNDGLHTVLGGAVGSPLYMSPEQVRAEPNVDHRADIWALGVVLFEMLTGTRPFQGDAQAVFMGILSGEIPTVAKYLRRVDPGLVDLIARCMRRERSERIGSAAEVAAQLDQYAGRGAAASLRQTSPDGQLPSGEGAESGGSLAPPVEPGSGGASLGASMPTPSAVLAASAGAPSARGAGAGGANVGGPSVGGPSVGGPSVGGPSVGGANVGGANVGGANVGGPSVGGPNVERPSVGAPGAGALPLALLGGGPRAPLGQVHEAAGAPSQREAGPVGASGPAMGAIRAPAAGQAASVGQAAGVMLPRAGGSGPNIAVAAAGGSSWDEDAPTLQMRASAESAWPAARQRVPTGQHPAAGSPAAAVATPLPSLLGSASAGPAPAAASGGAQPAPAQPAPAQPALGAAPERPYWGGTVRMTAPQMPDGAAPAPVAGAAVAPPAGSFGAPPGRMLESTVKLDADAVASPADSRMSTSAAASAAGQMGSSSTSPLVAKSPSPSASQTGAHAAQDATPQGDGQKRQKMAAVLAIAAAALSLILAGMFIAMRSGEGGTAAPVTASSGSVAPEDGAPAGEKATPPVVAPTQAPIDAPSAQPSGTLPGSTATAAPTAPTPSTASPPSTAPTSSAAPSVLPVDSRTGAAPGSIGGAGAGSPPGGAAPSAKPREVKTAPASSQAARTTPAPNPCAGLTSFLKKNCEAKLKK